MKNMKKALLPLMLAAMMLIMSMTAAAATVISPALITVTPDNSEVIIKSVSFTGKKATPKITVEVNGGVISKKYYQVIFTKNGKTTTPTKAGTYSAKCIFKKPYVGTVKSQLTINKANRSIKVNKAPNNTEKDNVKITLSGLSEGAKMKSKKIKSNGGIRIDGNKISVKKGVKKAIARFKLTTSATDNYNKDVRTVTVKVIKNRVYVQVEKQANAS